MITLHYAHTRDPFFSHFFAILYVAASFDTLSVIAGVTHLFSLLCLRERELTLLVPLSIYLSLLIFACYLSSCCPLLSLIIYIQPTPSSSFFFLSTLLHLSLSLYISIHTSLSGECDIDFCSSEIKRGVSRLCTQKRSGFLTILLNRRDAVYSPCFLICINLHGGSFKSPPVLCLIIHRGRVHFFGASFKETREIKNLDAFI